MIRRLLLAATAAVIAAVGVTTAGAGGPARPARSVPLSHSGQWLVDGSGRVVIDHGFNVVAKLAPYDPARVGFGADDAAFLADHGFTVVRLGVIPAALEPAPDEFDDAYLDSIARTVHTLSTYGIRSLLDFHQDLYNEKYGGEGLPAWMAIDDGIPPQPQAGFPGSYFAMPALWRAFDNLWDDADGPGGIGLRERMAQMWAHVAQRFRGDPAVLGYDIFNEPYPGSDYASCFPPAGCASDDKDRLAPFMLASIKAIHAVDPTHLAFYEPWLMFDYGAPTALGGFADDMSGMSFHDYCLATVGFPETPPTRTICNTMVEERVMANALEHARTSGDALLLSEFGAVTNETELREILSLADAHGISWTNWAYCHCGDPTGNGTAEALVYDPAKPPVGDNVNDVTLGVLDEPYPRLVAGTPGAFSFDPDSRRFTFEYSTKGVTGSLRPGLLTEIWVGSMHYPRGYRVVARGAHVVSRPGADVLQLKSKRTAGTVTVTLSPAP